MANRITAGSAVVADNGSVVKSGLAELIYDEFIDNFAADAGIPLPPADESVDIRKAYAAIANRMATAIAANLNANQTPVYAPTTGGALRTINVTGSADPDIVALGDVLGTLIEDLEATGIVGV